MDFAGYTKTQLQAIISACYKQASRWACLQTLPVDSTTSSITRTYILLVVPGEDKERFVLTSHKGRSSILTVSKGRFRHTGYSVIEEELIHELVFKLDSIEVELVIANVRCRADWSEMLCKSICRQLYAFDPVVFQSILDGLDLDSILKHEEKVREQARRYQENKRSREFSLREQQSISRAVLTLVENSLQPQLNQGIFRDRGSVSIRWTLPTDEYLSQLLMNKLTADDVDTSGNLLLESIGRIFSMPVDSILKKLFSSKTECCRRFALQFSDSFTNSGLIDADPKVRLLAKQKVGKK